MDKAIMCFIFFISIQLTGNRIQGCEIEFHPPMVFVKFGGYVTVNCNTSCSNTVGIGWESSNGGTGLEEGVSSSDLKIDGVTDWNIDPQCYIVFSNDAQKIKRLPITAYKMPDKVSMPEPTSPMKATGEYYPIQCNVVDVAPANRLTISWYKGNEMIYEESPKDPRSSPDNENSQMTIQVVAEDHGKEVWCEAKLNLLPAEQSPPPVRSESHALIVFYPPTFTEPNNETLKISAGTETSLNCTATGNPSPVYSWHFADSTMQKRIQEQNVTGPILILDTRVSGVFSCTASNVVGETTKYFNIIGIYGNWVIFTALRITLVCLFLLLIDTLAFVTRNKTLSFTKGQQT